MLNLINISNSIINDYHNNINFTFNINDNKISDIDKLSILNILLDNIHNNNIISATNTINNFKMEQYYLLLDYIVNNFIIIYNKCDNKKLHKLVLVFELLLIKLTMLNKGQSLLLKLEYIISYTLINNNIINYLRIASRYGTFITFKFWLDKIENLKINNKIYDLFFVNSITNSDDRIFKFLLNKITHEDKLYLQKNCAVIKGLLKLLGDSYIPPKYILKRIKLLSTKISLYPYFQYMIKYFNNIKILHELHKYYYTIPHTFESLILVNNILINNFNNEITNKIFYIIKTDDEKIMLNIISNLTCNLNIECYNLNNLLIEKVVINNYHKIIDIINWKLIMNIPNPINQYIFQILIKNNLLIKYIYNNNNVDIRIFFFTRFVMYTYKNNFNNDNLNKLILINKILHKLRIISKRISKSKITNYNIRMYNILREIKNYEPNNKKSILKNGSIEYQYQKQNFTNLPPRHLLPGEIHQYSNFLIKEKVDGILINNLPIGIFPNHDIITKYQVKAEYIEDLDLYMIFDIDIPNTTLIDRYNILRQLHKYTINTSLIKINNLNEFFDILDQERQIIKIFLKDNHGESIKWFPKFSCLVNNSELNDQLIKNIILDSELSKKLNDSELYKCDGLILSPIDGSRDIKIKPLSMMTIDILFTNNKWIDKDNNDLTLIIESNMQLKENKIYRCKPILNNDSIKFIVDMYRYDKKKPNSKNIVNNIYNILKYDWLQDTILNKSLYYYENPKKIYSKKLISMLKCQSDILYEQITKLKPLINQNWLDLGCGKGKLIPIIQKYNPQQYLGLDIDKKCLVKSLKYHDENQDTYLFNQCDLSKDWKESCGQWFSFYDYNIKYDYVIANFSVMHFFTDIFWVQLDNIVSTGTKFMFNVVSKYVGLTEWNESQSFLKINDDKVIYSFEWIHDISRTELFISEEKIIKQIEKFKWKVIDKVVPTSKYELCKFYTWWIIEKL